jgi:hypothetical protein
VPESLIDHIRRHTTLAPNDAILGGLLGGAAVVLLLAAAHHRWGYGK